jgi:hypothetical protein
MKRLMKEVLEELLQVFKGKTLDVVLPPLLFFVLYSVFDLLIAVIGSIVLSGIFFLHRVRKNDPLIYTISGLIGVVLTSVFTYISNNASNFFLPDIIATSSLIIVTTVSLIWKRPIASYVSHITRGWNYNWFQLDTVKPAYMEVSIFWLGFFVVRLFTEIYLYLFSSVEDLVIANIVLGLPITIIVLVISYVYGIYRLHKLGGPGVDEFMDGKEPPYRGQTRGF